MFQAGLPHFIRRYFCVYRVSQEGWIKLRESVPYVELYQYNPKHLHLKLNVTEIMAIEKCGILGCPRTVRRP